MANFSAIGKFPLEPTILQRLHPTTHKSFCRIGDAIGTAAEKSTIEDVYRTLEPLNFSKGFLELVAATNPGIISILPVLQVFWSDWGSPERLLQVREVLANSAREVTARNPVPSNRRKSVAEPRFALLSRFV